MDPALWEFIVVCSGLEMHLQRSASSRHFVLFYTPSAVESQQGDAFYAAFKPHPEYWGSAIQ